MVESDHYNLASVSENAIPTILIVSQVLKTAGLDNVSGAF